MCGYALDGVRFRHSGDHLSGQKCNQAFSKDAANLQRKCKKHPSEYRLAIIGIRTALPKGGVNGHEVRKGTLIDDDGYVVRRGIEPNPLIA